jgi:hypothetical protein
MRVLRDQQPSRNHIAAGGEALQQAVTPELIIVPTEPVILNHNGERRRNAIVLAEKRVVCGDTVCAKEKDCQPTGAMAVIEFLVTFQNGSSGVSGGYPATLAVNSIEQGI